MLNISPNSVAKKIGQKEYNSFKIIDNRPKMRMSAKLLFYLFLPVVILMIMPWTQNIRALGNVTALKPEQRPQTIHTVIAGKIEKWFVQEGQFVSKGDTILFISEVKDEYFDPNLLSRTDEQLKAKELSVQSYMEKVRANDNQIAALTETLKLKLEQAKNKLQQAVLYVKSDSMDLVAAKTNLDIANEQFNRMKELYAKGLKSLTELENRKLKLQETQAKIISQENKLLTSRNQLINAKIELETINAEFRDKISKSESEKFSAMSNMYDAEAVVTKLQNQYMNYMVRTGMYFITAPQDGYITKAIKTGIGETIKEGSEIVSIMPANIDLAVEIYVAPIDVPLLAKGSNVRVQFDGWPAIVFSGWPSISYGTYGGKVIAIDNFISENGKYRILVVPDKNDHPWPKELRVGGGVNSMMLLKDVPVWYEIWRNINGFPPEYYKNTENKPAKKK